MGYYTRYTLTIAKYEADPVALRELIINRINEAADLAIFDASGEPEEAVKWYEHEDHMRTVSRDFPGILLTLKGEGEEPADIWEKHFLNGRMQECCGDLVIPPLDFAKFE